MQRSDVYERRLSDWWDRINRTVFGGALLAPPAIALSETASRLGEWDPRNRMIRISREFVQSAHWLAVVEVLKHEMAHQYVTDVLGADDEAPHGPAFRMVCERFAIDRRASGTPSGAEPGLLLKVRKLFALGASPNEHEAKAALRMARELLDHVGVAEEDALDPTPDDVGVTHVGRVVPRIESDLAVVADVLGRFFRVRCIWVLTLDPDGRLGHQLEIVGRRADLQVAEHVHGFLIAEGERLWDRSDGRRGKRARRDFLEGTMLGFRESLAAHERARAGRRDRRADGALAKVDQDIEVDEYFERRHPQTRALRGSRRRRGVEFANGIDAGQTIELRRSVAAGKPKLLGT